MSDRNVNKRTEDVMERFQSRFNLRDMVEVRLGADATPCACRITAVRFTDDGKITYDMQPVIGGEILVNVDSSWVGVQGGDGAPVMNSMASPVIRALFTVEVEYRDAPKRAFGPTTDPDAILQALAARPDVLGAFARLRAPEPATEWAPGSVEGMRAAASRLGWLSGVRGAWYDASGSMRVRPLNARWEAWDDHGVRSLDLPDERAALAYALGL